MIKKRKVTTTYEYNENGILLKKTVVEETEEEAPVLNALVDVLENKIEDGVSSYLKSTPVGYSDSTKVHYPSGGVGLLGKVEG